MKASEVLNDLKRRFPNEPEYFAGRRGSVDHN